MRVLKNAGLGLAAGGFVLAGSGAAFAGAWDNMGVGSLDLLFAPEKFVVEAGATYADRNVDYKVKNATTQGRKNPPALPTDVDTLAKPGSKKERVTPNIWDYRVGVKANLMEDLDCLGRLNSPFSINEEMDPTWAGRYGGYETTATTMGLDATCAYKFQIDGSSNFRVIAGVKALDLTYQSVGMVYGNALSPFFTDDYFSDGEVKSDGMAWGWRAGVAYEIPAYALRASLVYDSKVKLDLTGDTYIFDVPTASGGIETIHQEAYASITAPQSVELNVQSGIAPGWLATFGVKWMDWSSIDRLVLYNGDGSKSTDRVLGFTDGWTVKAGIGHQFNEKLSLGSSVQWDRGVGGSYSDNYTFAAGGAYALNDKVKVTLGGAAIYKTAGEGDAINLANGSGYTYEYDGSWNFAVDTKLRIAF